MRLNPSNSKRRRSSAGFTLAEVAVGGAIFAVMSASLYTGISQGFSVIQTAREELRANQILLDKMEAIRLYNWDQIKDGTGTAKWIRPTFVEYYDPTATSSATTVPAGEGGEETTCPEGPGVAYAGTIAITTPATLPTAYQATVRQVTITLTWNSGGRQFTRTMRTYMSQYGTQKYLYN